MATTSRRGGATGKDRKGTNASPSPSPSINRRSSKPSSNRTTPTSSCDHGRPVTPPTAKPIPNYLRPTISSIPKRSVTDSSTLAQASKPSLGRMRSFDKASPSSLPQKSNIRSSSTTNPTTGVRDIKTMRSSSFSHKSTTASTSSARSASSDRAGARIVSRGGLRRSPSNTTRKDMKGGGAPSSSTKKAPKIVTSKPDHETETESIEQHLGVEEHDMVNIEDNELQSLPEISEMLESDQDLGDPTSLDQVEIKQEHHQEKQLQPIEKNHDDHIVGEVEEQENISSPMQDDDHTHDQAKSMAVNEVAQEPMEREIRIPEQPQHAEEEKDQSQTIDEEQAEKEVIVEEVSSADHHQQPEVVQNAEEHFQMEQDAGKQAEPDQKTEQSETLIAEKKQEIPKQEAEQSKDETKTEEANLKEEKEQTVSSPLTTTTSSSTTDNASVSTSTEEKQTEEKIEKPETPVAMKKPAASTPTPSGGKKGSQVPYNSVIEETSKKLMTKKNKVLALAGAFETVISLQDNTSPSKH